MKAWKDKKELYTALFLRAGLHRIRVDRRFLKEMKKRRRRGEDKDLGGKGYTHPLAGLHKADDVWKKKPSLLSILGSKRKRERKELLLLRRIPVPPTVYREKYRYLDNRGIKGG